MTTEDIKVEARLLTELEARIRLGERRDGVEWNSGGGTAMDAIAHGYRLITIVKDDDYYHGQTTRTWISFCDRRQHTLFAESGWSRCCRVCLWKYHLMLEEDE